MHNQDEALRPQCDHTVLKLVNKMDSILDTDTRNNLLAKILEFLDADFEGFCAVE